jgi:8-oxo-dGTP diphosphatase
MSARAAAEPADRPAVTVDVVLFTLVPATAGGRRNALKLLLTRAAGQPAAWALPSRPVPMTAALEVEAQAALGAVVDASSIFLEQLYTFGEPSPSAAERRVTIAYYALVRRDQVRLPAPATVGAAEVDWFPADAPPPTLSAGQRRILAYALWRLRNKIEYADIAFQFLPEQFSLTELRQVYEAVTGAAIDKRNFNRKVLGGGVLEETGALQAGQAHRPARLYRFVRDREARAPGLAPPPA